MVSPADLAAQQACALNADEVAAANLLYFLQYLHCFLKIGNLLDHELHLGLEVHIKTDKALAFGDQLLVFELIQAVVFEGTQLFVCARLHHALYRYYEQRIKDKVGNEQAQKIAIGLISVFGNHGSSSKISLPFLALLSKKKSLILLGWHTFSTRVKQGAGSYSSKKDYLSSISLSGESRTSCQPSLLST